MLNGAAQGLMTPPFRAALAERDQLIEQQAEQILQLQSTVDELSEQLERLKDQILEAQRQRFGQSSERGGHLQEDLFPLEAPVPEQDEAEPSTAAPQKQRQTPPPRGRRALPPELPRETQRYDYDAETRAQLEAGRDRRGCDRDPRHPRTVRDAPSARGSPASAADGNRLRGPPANCRNWRYGRPTRSEQAA